MQKVFSFLVLNVVSAITITMPSFTVLAQDDYLVPNNTPAHILRGVGSAERTDEQTARDVARLPAEILTLADLNEGDHIIEFTSFGQYYTTMLSSAVGDTGIVEMYDMPYMAQFGADDTGKAFAESHTNANYYMQNYGEVTYPENIDAVYNILYYHDLGPQEVDTAVLNKKMYAALKPGGKYVIVDHKAEDGSGWRDAGTIHRMGVETIISEVSAAGFELIIDSDILAHPEDDKTLMVFSPGTRGGTDRATLVFQKPF